MLLYLRTSKGDINTQNTGNIVGELVDGSGTESYNWAFPASLKPYEIRRSQAEELGNDVGNMLLAVKVREDNDKETDIYVGIDGFFYQRYGQRVLDVSDINSIVASAVAKLASTQPFPVGYSYLTNEEKPTLPSFGAWEVKQYGSASDAIMSPLGVPVPGPIYAVTRTA